MCRIVLGSIRSAVLIMGLISVCLSSSAFARDTTHMLSIENAMNTAAAKEKLNAGVSFYFSGQKTPKIAKEMVEAVSNRKTNAFGKSDEVACNWVFLSAMIALQERALREGANAVVDIHSFYKKNEMKSSTEFECHAGGIMAGVALKGKMVKLAK